MKQRLSEIDILRGVGIIAIILIHCCAYFLNDTVAKFLWNISQFAVQTFVFVSGYIYFKKGSFESANDFFKHIVKRVKRLIIPYWIFSVFYIGLLAIFDTSKLSLLFVIRWVTLSTSGNEIGWFVVLFLEFAFLMPLLAYWGEKKRWLFHFYSLVAVGTSIYLLANQIPINFKLIMWIPWSVVLIASWYAARYEKEKWFYPVSFIVSFIAFYILLSTFQEMGRSINFYDNKYPPNLYVLAYGILITLGLWWLAGRGIFKKVIKPLAFLGVNSYSLFFIHFGILFLLSYLVKFDQFAWWEIFVGVFMFSVLTQLVLSGLKTRVKS